MDQKRPFAEMADRDKMRYENELKLLFPGENTPKRRRKKKDPNAPKRICKRRIVVENCFLLV